MVVTGGITWWKDFICCACFNLLDQRDEVGNMFGRLISLSQIYGAITLVENETDTDKKYTEPNGDLCCHLSLWSMSTSTQKRVGLSVGQCKHTLVIDIYSTERHLSCLSFNSRSGFTRGTPSWTTRSRRWCASRPRSYYSTPSTTSSSCSALTATS